MQTETAQRDDEVASNNMENRLNFCVVPNGDNVNID